MASKISKSEMQALPTMETRTASKSHLIQNLEVLSSHANRIRVIASVPGAVGFSLDGSIIFEYTAASHFVHENDVDMIVNLNHHGDEVIGRIVSTETDLDGNLIVEAEIFEEYSYFVPIIKAGLNDGHSIESIITEGRMVSDTRVLVENYLLTGIAFLFTKPPACDKEFCHVLSSDASQVDLTQIATLIDDMSEDDLNASYANIMREMQSRKLDSTTE